MQHVDPEVLALVALGEPADDGARAHLATCAECTAEVHSFAATVGTARSVTPADALIAPPPEVWDRVRGELGLSPALEPDGTGSGRAAAAGGAAAGGSRRRGSRAPWIAAAAAAGVVVGGAGGAWFVGRTADVPGPLPVVAQASLDPLPGWSAEGAAHVEVADDGTRELVLTVDGGDAEGFREVWLIDRDVTKLVSLGVLEGGSGRFVLPADLDLGEYPVVDVSDEPFDGDPAHSSDSIVRGVLDV